MLVSPQFHNYSSAIKNALEYLGFEVGVHLYDSTDNVVEQIRNKWVHERARKTRKFSSEFQTAKALDALEKFNPNFVLVVKGDLLSDQWWEKLGASNFKKAIWLYDELHNMYFEDSQFDQVDNIYSYSQRDAETLSSRGHAATYLPLGFDSLQPYEITNTQSINFIGARYPSRESLLEELFSRNVPVVAYGKEWSQKAQDKIRSGCYSRPNFPTAAGLMRAQSYGVMAGSLATLNLHGDQNGFTMRTFESSGSGGLQITDRQDVNEFLEIGREVLVFAEAGEIEDYYSRLIKDPHWANQLREAGSKRVLAEHTLVHRLKKIVKNWA